MPALPESRTLGAHHRLFTVRSHPTPRVRRGVNYKIGCKITNKWAKYQIYWRIFDVLKCISLTFTLRQELLILREYKLVHLL